MLKLAGKRAVVANQGLIAQKMMSLVELAAPAPVTMAQSVAKVIPEQREPVAAHRPAAALTAAPVPME